MSNYVNALTSGQALNLASLPQTLAYAGDFIDTITVVYNGISYVQTFGNDGTNITTISAWVPQP